MTAQMSLCKCTELQTQQSLHCLHTCTQSIDVDELYGNVEIVGDKPVKNDAWEMSMSEEAKQNAWPKHYERLLNLSA